MIILTSDLLKINTKSLLEEGEQSINIDWLKELIEPVVFEVTGHSINALKVSENNKGFDRLGLFSKLGMPVTSAGWAMVYEGKHDVGTITDFFARYLECSDFVITFEAPGYLLNVLASLNKRFIDISISPIRFMKDYQFAIRGSGEVQRVIERYRQYGSDYIPSVALNKALAKRKIRTSKISDGALFVGQIEVDASLVQDQRIPGLDDIRAVLEECVFHFGKVYYKGHPHAKNIAQLKALVSSLHGCEWLDRNIYDSLGADDWKAVISMSSGTIEEAKLFGHKTIRVLKEHWNYPSLSAEDDERQGKYPCHYISNEEFFSSRFWSEIFSSAGVKVRDCKERSFYIGEMVKQSLNQKWGR